MSTPTKKRVRLQGGVLYKMRKRKEWRQRFVRSALDLAGWQTGAAGRDAVISEMEKCHKKLLAWLPEDYAKKVVLVAQKRAVALYRQGGSGV